MKAFPDSDISYRNLYYDYDCEIPSDGEVFQYRCLKIKKVIQTKVKYTFGSFLFYLIFSFNDQFNSIPVSFFKSVSELQQILIFFDNLLFIKCEAAMMKAPRGAIRRKNILSVSENS